MTEHRREFTEGEKSILEELKSIADHQKLISEHFISLEAVFWQLLSELGGHEKGVGEIDLHDQGEYHTVRPIGKHSAKTSDLCDQGER